MTGEPGRAPLRPGVNLVDLTAGTNATMGISDGDHRAPDPAGKARRSTCR